MSTPGTPRGGYNLTFWRVLRSEWTKFRSLPSTWWTLGATFVVTVGFALLMAWSTRLTMELAADGGMGDMGGMGGVDIEAAFTSLSTVDMVTNSMVIGQIVLIVLGVQMVTNEYSSGMIRSTLAAIPRRWQMLAAKTLLLGSVTFCFTFVLGYLIQFLTWGLIKDFAIDLRFDLDGLKSVAGLSLATALLVIMALAVGVLMRNTAAAIFTVLAFVLVVPSLLGLLQWDWVATLITYLPSQVSYWLYTFGAPLEQATDPISFPIALVTLCGWAFVPLIGAGALLRARDA